MARIGWSYLTVVRHSDAALAASPALRRFVTCDGGWFDAEQAMLDELGASGWDLLWVREAGAELHYYFKRPRS